MSNLKTTIVKSLYYFKSNKFLFSSCAKSQRFFWLMNSLEVKVAFPRHVLYFQHIFGNITDSHFLIYFRSRAVAAPVIPTLNLAKLKRWKKFFFFPFFFNYYFRYDVRSTTIYFTQLQNYTQNTWQLCSFWSTTRHSTIDISRQHKKQKQKSSFSLSLLLPPLSY